MGAAAFVLYASDHHRTDDAARAASTSATMAPVEQGPNYLAFGDPAASMGIVLYPGAKVEYTAYDPLIRDLAKRGHFVVVVEMPFNFAFFNINAADGIRAAYPQMEYWWVGGHSPGGSMAAQYAANHADDPSLAGLVLLGTYSASDLSASNLEAIIVYGENNRVLDRDKLQKNASLLPPNSLTVEIPGGNHAKLQRLRSAGRRRAGSCRAVGAAGTGRRCRRRRSCLRAGGPDGTVAEVSESGNR